MKGKKRKGADGPKQPKLKQPKPKPKGKPDNLGWVGPVSPQARALKERLEERANSRIQIVKCFLKGFIRSKLTRSQVQHDSGLNQARLNSQRWNDNVKLELQHLAAAPPAGTSLVAIQRHVAVTLATWDAVWGEYLHPKWAEQKMRLHGAQERVLERYFNKLEEEAASVSQQEWGTRKQLVVFFGSASIGTR
ncbi:uncharacterized protein HaLaN_22924, partial [Haematococcus lacustris]